MKILLMVLVFFGFHKSYAGTTDLFKNDGIESNQISSADGCADSGSANCGSCVHC